MPGVPAQKSRVTISNHYFNRFNGDSNQSLVSFIYYVDNFQGQSCFIRELLYHYSYCKRIIFFKVNSFIDDIVWLWNKGKLIHTVNLMLTRYMIYHTTNSWFFKITFCLILTCPNIAVKAHTLNILRGTLSKY